MNQQDQQAIDELFQYLYRAAQQSGQPDAQADALIQRYVKKAPPGLLYQMAQALVGQQHALRQLRTQLAAYQQPGGAPAGFGRPRGNQGYGAPAYQPDPYQGYQRPGGGQGFLAGAGQIALGVGGGILGAEILTSIFDGGGLFGGEDGYEREYAEGYQEGFAAGDDYGDQDGGGYDDGGGFDGGDF